MYMGKTQQVGRLVLIKLMVASLSIQSLIILVFPVFHNIVTPTEISNTENHKNYYMTEVGFIEIPEHTETPEHTNNQ